MKKLFTLLSVIFVGTLALAACGGAASGAALDDNAWAMVQYRNASGEMVGLLPDSLVTVEFKDGELGGTAGCNHYFGSYEAKDDKLTVGPMGMTEMWCEPAPLMDQEQAYLAAVGEVARFQITDGELTLFDSSGAELARFESWEAPSQ